MVTRHACALVKTGTRYLGMSPRGGIAGPHTANKTLAPCAVNARSEDQHGTRNEQQGEDDFSERCFVDSPEKFEAKPGSSKQERQTDHE